MEEMEVEDSTGARKRKRDADGEEVAPLAAAAGAVLVLPVSGEAAAVGLGCFSWKELSLGEKEEGEGVAEESVEEVMRWLETEISSSPSPGKGDDGYGFVTINGNEESCGPSFSAAASTVMASIDTRLGAPPPPTPIPWPWPEPGSTLLLDDQKMSEAEDGLDEEEWLLDLLAAAGPALELFSLEP